MACKRSGVRSSLSPPNEKSVPLRLEDCKGIFVVGRRTKKNGNIEQRSFHLANRFTYDIMNTGETKECVHLTQRKTRCCSTGFFYSVLVEGGLSLRLTALFSLIQPFTNVVGDYACHDREKKRKKQVHRTHPLPTTNMGWQPVHYNIKMFLNLREIEIYPSSLFKYSSTIFFLNS